MRTFTKRKNPARDMFSDHENRLEPLLLIKKSSFFHHQLSDHHQNPINFNPKQDDDHDPPFFSNFPSPFFDEHELPLNQILPHHNPAMAPGKATDQTDTNFSLITKKETSKRGLKTPKLKEKAHNNYQPSKRQNLGIVSRKRTGKKDRHSKICTAQGIRDRRMRLSLQIARRFFDLQDMLGYDKASSTIEWLFSKSKKAIRELMTKAKENTNNFNFSVSDGKRESFLSECEVVSGVHEESSNNEMGKDQLGNILPNNEKKMRKPNNLRESREKARARARWRTREKMMIKRLENPSPNYQNDDVQKLRFLNSPLEAVIDQEFSGNYTSLSDDVGTIEKLLGNSSLSTSNICPISDNYNYQYCIDPNNTFMGFLRNWELLSNIERLNSSQVTVTNQGSSMAGNSNVSVNNYSGASSGFPLFHQ